MYMLVLDPARSLSLGRHKGDYSGRGIHGVGSALIGFPWKSRVEMRMLLSTLMGLKFTLWSDSAAGLFQW